MAKSEKLFDLVKSLTKSEKRFFRMQSNTFSAHGESKYLELFDVIDKQTVYDESIVQAHFADEVGAGTFAALKRYLYQAVLKTLHFYKLEKTPESYIPMLISQAGILEARGLHDQALTLLKKARKLALRHELSSLAVSSMLQMFSILFTKDVDHVERQLYELLAEIKECGQMYADYLETLPIVAQTYLMMSSDYKPRNQEQLSKYEKLMDNSLMQDPNKSKSVLAKRNILLCLATYHRMLYNRSEALKYYKEMYYLVVNTKQLRESSGTVAAALFNVCICCVEAHNDQEFEEYHGILLDCVQAEHWNVGVNTMQNVLLLQAYMQCEKGEFVECLESLEELARLTPTPNEGLKIEYVMFGLQLHACASFGLGKFEDAIAVLHQLLSTPNAQQHSRQRYFTARMMLLIIHFELGNLDTLESLLNSVRVQLQARNYTYRVESCIRKFMTSVVRRGSTQLSREQWRPLYEELLELQQDKFERVAIGWFNYPRWVRSKMSQQSFSQLSANEFGLGEGG